MKNILLVLLLLILIIPTFRTLLRPGFFPMHDDLQSIRLLGMDRCIKDGQIPCRWVPEMGYQYGYPQFNYYSPLPYYVMEVVHLLGFSFLDSIKAGFVLSLIFSSLTMFYFIRSIFGPIPALVSAIFYSYAPVRASDIYSRGAMAEAWSFVFMPLILLGLNLSAKKDFKGWIILSFGVAGLFTSHNPTAFVFIPLSFLMALGFLIFNTEKRLFLPQLLKTIAFYLLGVGIAAFFVLPAILEIKYAHTETLRFGYFDFRAHFISLRQLLTSTHFGYGSSEIGPFDDLSLTVSPIYWTLGLLSFVIASFLYLTKKIKSNFSWMFLLIILSFFSAFMAHQKSTPIWEIVPNLSYLQFPWRFLVIIDLALSALIGGLIFYLQSERQKFILAGFLISLVILLNGLIFTPKLWFNINDQDKLSGEAWQKQLTASIFDYLPKSAKFPPTSEASSSAYFISGRGEINGYQRSSNAYNFSAEVLEDGQITIPTFDFPGWKVRVDERMVDYHPNGDLGLITFNIDKGTHQVQAKLENTPVRTIGNILTVLSLVLIGLMIKFKPRFLC